MSALIVAPPRFYGLGFFAAREFSSGEWMLVIEDRRIVDDQHPYPQ